MDHLGDKDDCSVAVSWRATMPTSCVKVLPLELLEHRLHQEALALPVGQFVVCQEECAGEFLIALAKHLG